MEIAAQGQDAVLRALLDLAAGQFEVNAEVNLLAPDPAPPAISADSLRYARSHREELIEILGTVAGEGPGRSIARAMATRMEELLAGANQFVALTAPERDELEGIYVRLLAELRELLLQEGDSRKLRRGYEQMLSRQFGALRSYLGCIGDSRLLEPLWRSAALIRVPCADYTPELQLRLLGLDPRGIREPVLDLGCGREARLVRYVRSLGIEIVGVDRHAPEGCTRRDWLDFGAGGRRWGTVVSHMAFSNHFRHHHLRRDGRWAAYAAVYVAILRALLPGGCFAYTPGLPFIESLLPPDAYRIERRSIGDLDAVTVYRTDLHAAPG